MTKSNNAKPYGAELIIDLHGCNLEGIVNREKLHEFFVTLCERIDMKRHGDPLYWEDTSDIPHLRGVSAMQFIETSTIVCHPLPMLNSVYVNIFSCKEFDPDMALSFCMKFWRAKREVHTVVPRT
jgi:S-adenosylmethionine/arginine decarboxylase-like enzyme